MEIDIKNLTESQEEEKELFVNKVDSRLVLDLNRSLKKIIKIRLC